MTEDYIALLMARMAGASADEELDSQIMMAGWNCCC